MAASRNRPRKLLYLGIVAVIPVVIAILVLIYSQNSSADQANACRQEYATVQAGLFAFMAGNNLTTVPASSGTNDMTAPVPLYDQTTGATNPGFIRLRKTQWRYGWDSKGTITTIAESPNGPSVPQGCVVIGH